MKTDPKERKKIADRYAKLSPSHKLAFIYGTAPDDPVIWPDEPKKEKEKPSDDSV